MSFLKNLFNRGGATTTVRRQEVTEAECPHVTLAPRWDSVGDMGNVEKATGFTCDGCHKSFTAEEARALMASEADRLRGSVGH